MLVYRFRKCLFRLEGRWTVFQRIRLDQFRLWKFRSSNQSIFEFDSLSRHGKRSSTAFDLECSVPLLDHFLGWQQVFSPLVRLVPFLCSLSNYSVN